MVLTRKSGWKMKKKTKKHFTGLYKWFSLAGVEGKLKKRPSTG